MVGDGTFNLDEVVPVSHAATPEVGIETIGGTNIDLKPVRMQRAVLPNDAIVASD